MSEKDPVGHILVEIESMESAIKNADRTIDVALKKLIEAHETRTRSAHRITVLNAALLKGLNRQ